MGDAAKHIHARASLRALDRASQARSGIVDQVGYFAAAVEVPPTFRAGLRGGRPVMIGGAAWIVTARNPAGWQGLTRAAPPLGGAGRLGRSD